MALFDQPADQIAEQPWELLQYRPGLDAKIQEKRLKEYAHTAHEQAWQYMSASEEVRQVDQHISYLMGNQWPTKRPSYKAAPINNRLLRQLEEVTAVLTDVRPTFEVQALNKMYHEQAEIHTKTNKAWWTMQDNDLKLALATIHAYLSTGFLRVVWNSSLMGGEGDFQLIPLGISQVMPIGPTHELQEWQGVVYRDTRSLAFFKRRYPLAGWKVKPSVEHSSYARPFSRPKYVGQHAFELLSPQMKRVIGGVPQYLPGVLQQAPYTEFWIKDEQLNTSDNPVIMGSPDTNWAYRVEPGNRLYPRGRLIITGGDEFDLMYDGPNPFWHGRYPFITVRLKPVPWQFHGISELRTKIPLQDIVNTVLAGILDMIKKAVNPPLIFPDNAFSYAVKAQMDPNMPNAKIGYSPQAPAAPQYARVPDLPSFVQNTLLYAQNEMDDDSGLLDVGGLSRKKVTPAGNTLESLKENQQTIMRLRGRYIEVALRELGEQMISNFMQFYDVRRRMFLLGRDGVSFEDVFDWVPGTMTPQGVHPQDHRKQFVFLMAAGSTLNSNREKEALVAFALAKEGRYSTQALFRKLGLENEYERVMRELGEEEVAMIRRMTLSQLLSGAAGGTQGGPGGKGSQNLQNLLQLA